MRDVSGRCHPAVFYLLNALCQTSYVMTARFPARLHSGYTKMIYSGLACGSCLCIPQSKVMGVIR